MSDEMGVTLIRCRRLSKKSANLFQQELSWHEGLVQLEGRQVVIASPPGPGKHLHPVALHHHQAWKSHTRDYVTMTCIQSRFRSMGPVLTAEMPARTPRVQALGVHMQQPPSRRPKPGSNKRGNCQN